MKKTETARIIAGSIAVYLCVATVHACGSHGATSGAASGPGLGGSGGSTGVGQGGGSGQSSASSATGSQETAASSGITSASSVMNPVPDAYAEESGSRIKAKWRVGDDNSKEFVGWHDSLLQTDCDWRAFDDGRQHCAPRVTVTAAERYTDSACTVKKMLVGGAGEGCISKYAILSQASVMLACNQPAQYITYAEVGVQYAGKIYSTAGAPCYEVDIGSWQLYEVGAALPASTFVAATIKTDQ